MYTSRERVPVNTSVRINRAIARSIEENVRYFARRPEQIPQRLRELDEEWDIERAIQANAAVAGFMGLLLGTAGRKRWLVVPGLVSIFLFQHAVQGWCPPVPVLRRMGFRTSFEIERERHALKALLGDYQVVADAEDRVAAALQAVER